MSLQFGSTKIGAIQFNGVTIGEARYNGQIVYRSVIRITAPAPTFLDLPPWLVLPEAEGVTYTVLGHVAPGQPVEVHAYAEEGYELEGVTRWWRTITNYDPQMWTFTTVGNHTFTIPEWASTVDIVCIGGGGSGGNGGSAVAKAGEGGKAGTFGYYTHQVQNLTSRQLTAVVGGGGTIGSGAAGRGSSGSLSRVIYTGTGTQVGNAGQGGDSGRGALGDGNLAAGRTATSISYNGTSYLGGSGGSNVNNGVGRVGTAPGGGGGGGAGGIFGSYWNGGGGGSGRVWVTAYV